ncbi:MAG: YdcF family protein [Betaproteobacteria bacterium]|nr:YdcF family protein [Betaproteobacteria bacterium]
MESKFETSRLCTTPRSPINTPVQFILSKILAGVTQPLIWVMVWWAIALLVIRRRHRLALNMLWVENRYSIPSEELIGRHAGVIVLGGATGRPDIYLSRGQVPLSEAAERMTLPLTWMRAHPKFELIFSGGEGRLLATGTTEAELAGAFYRQQGVDMRRVRLEDSSRNTRENAQLVKALLGQRCENERWLLVTSASHMPRSVSEFDAVGCNTTPYPVDFKTSAAATWGEYSLLGGLTRWQIALHEWIGILFYRNTR